MLGVQESATIPTSMRDLKGQVASLSSLPKSSDPTVAIKPQQAQCSHPTLETVSGATLHLVSFLTPQAEAVQYAQSSLPDLTPCQPFHQSLRLLSVCVKLTKFFRVRCVPQSTLSALPFWAD